MTLNSFHNHEKRVVCRASKVCWAQKTYEQRVTLSFDDLFLNSVFPTWVFESEKKDDKIFMNRFVMACISDIPLQTISEMIGIHKNVWYAMKHFTRLAIWPHLHYNLRDFQIVQYERWCLLRRMKAIEGDFQHKLQMDYSLDPSKLVVLQRIFQIFLNTVQFLQRVHAEAKFYNKFLKTLSISNMQNMDAINALGVYDMKKNLYLAAVFNMERVELLHPDSIIANSKISHAALLPSCVGVLGNDFKRGGSSRAFDVEIEAVQLETSLTPLEDWIHFYG